MEDLHIVEDSYNMWNIINIYIYINIIIYIYMYLSTSTFLCWLGAHPSKPDSICARTLGAPALGWDVLLRVEKPPAVAVASVVVSCLRMCLDPRMRELAATPNLWKKK